MSGAILPRQRETAMTDPERQDEETKADEPIDVEIVPQTLPNPDKLDPIIPEGNDPDNPGPIAVE